MSNTLSKPEWQTWCNAYHEVDQTKIAFCRANELNYHQFMWLSN